MRHSNWIVKDANNKKSDLICHIRAKLGRITDESIVEINKVSKLDYQQLKARWELLPDNYKTHVNLGCS